MLKISERLARFQITTEPRGAWPASDLNHLFNAIVLLSDAMGGTKRIKNRIGKIVIERSDTGPHLGLAYRERIKLSASDPISTWSVIHELGHVWDARNDWKLSRELERYTGGFTNRFISSLIRFFPSKWDAGPGGEENRPGFHGRKTGCNAAGYFYGDKPSGSNWNFNRREDFAESVVMYCGWGNDNELSTTAHGRIERYLLPNGRRDPIYRIADNWSDYARYFYPADGDYSQTKRWKFIDELIHGLES